MQGYNIQRHVHTWHYAGRYNNIISSIGDSISQNMLIRQARKNNNFIIITNFIKKEKRKKDNNFIIITNFM